MKNKTIKLAVISALSATMMGCGGGGSSSGSAATQQGRFQDTNVDGLAYTGSFPGITTDGGRFNFQTGDVLAFSVGGIQLGTATGSSIVTLNSLNINNNQVSKIARLLQSLDNDSNLDNGIVVNTTARDALTVGTTEVDNVITALANTTTTTIDVNALITNIIATADTGGTYTAVTAASATAHVLATISCAYSGGFRGTEIDGTRDASGTFTANTGSSAEIEPLGFVISSNGATQVVFGADDSDPAAIESVGTVTFSIADDPALEFVDSGETLTLTLDTVDTLSGFVDETGGDAESISASRIGGGIDAVYRATGAFSGSGDAGLYTFDVAPESILTLSGGSTATGHVVTGVAYSVASDEVLSLTGSVIAGSLMGTVSSGATATATIDLSTGTITNGIWSAADSNSSSGSFTGSSCKLN